MTIKVKPTSDVAEKWRDVTPGRSAYYEKYAVPAGDTWAANTKAAAATFKQAIQAADIDKRFSGGVTRVGGAKYSRKVKDVGVSRFGPGVAAAAPDYETGVTPFLDEISKITLPPRKPRGDPANLDRVSIIAKALAAKRLQQRAAGA